MQILIAGCRDLHYQGSMWHLLLLPRCYCLLVKARRGCITGSGGMSQQCIQSTCGLAAMTSAPHAEGRQLDPGQVYVNLYVLLIMGLDCDSVPGGGSLSICSICDT